MSRDYADLLAALNGQGARYLLVGAFAVAFHSRPRFTKDLDLWVEPTAKNAPRVRKALLAFGAPARNVEGMDFTGKARCFKSAWRRPRSTSWPAWRRRTFFERRERRSEGLFLDQPTFNLGMEDLPACKRFTNRPKDRPDVRVLEMARQAAVLKARRKGKEPAR